MLRMLESWQKIHREFFFGMLESIACTDHDRTIRSVHLERFIERYVDLPFSLFGMHDRTTTSICNAFQCLQNWLEVMMHQATMRSMITHITRDTI
jgi:hypothetical protein